jgi:hypothetical protein
MSLLDGIDPNQFAIQTFVHNNIELGELYGVDEKTIRRWKAKLKQQDKVLGDGKFPSPAGRQYNEYKVLNADSYIVIGDSEIPHHDPELFEYAYQLMKKYQLDQMIINGDFIANDIFSFFSPYTNEIHSFEDNLQPAIEVLKVFSDQAKRIIINQGNHERRLPLLVKGQINLGDFLKELTKVEFQEYAYTVVKGSNGEITRVSHPDNYSGIIGSVTKRMHAKHLCNLIIGHDHQMGLLYDQSASHWLVHGGHCRREDMVSYKNLRDNCMPNWNHGFVMVLNNFPYLINKQNIDFYLGR